MDYQEKMSIKSFGVRLRQARRAKGVNQRELATALDAHQGWISELEAGKQLRLEVQTVYRLCRALGVSADYLLGLTGTADAADASGVPSGHPRQAAEVAGASS